MKAARGHRMASQVKKKLKNRPVLPRMAGLTKPTKVGHALERATLIAKVRGAQAQSARKRKRDEDMDVDEDGAEVDGDAEWMDVDEEEAGGKRRKGNSGTAVAVTAARMRAPRTDRTAAGMRDETVGGTYISDLRSTHSHHSKYLKRCSFGTSAKGNGICMQRLGRLTVQSVSRWYVSWPQCVP
jgi:hypothetical protein